MFIKIYFDDKPLYLCDDIDETIQPFIHHDDTIFIDELNVHALKSMIHEMGQPSIHAGVYFHKNLEELRSAFFKKFTVIQAGGGFVQNEKEEVLLIFRRGKWDLPKGKTDKGETVEKSALREVKEETGLKNIKIISPLNSSYYTYHEGTHYILKVVNWFHMKATGEQQLIPQQEEDIEKILWIKPTEVEQYLKNSFPSISDVVNQALLRTH